MDCKVVCYVESHVQDVRTVQAIQAIQAIGCMQAALMPAGGEREGERRHLPLHAACLPSRASFRSICNLRSLRSSWVKQPEHDAQPGRLHCLCVCLPDNLGNCKYDVKLKPPRVTQLKRQSAIEDETGNEPHPFVV